MASLNQATLIGNVGKDPELRSTNGGVKVASFSIATSETWKDKASGEKKEQTDWHNIVVFGTPQSDGLAGIVDQYVKKGSKIMVQGMIRARKWEKDGVDRYSTEIVLSGPNAKLILLGDAGGGGSRKGPASEDEYGAGGAAPARTMKEEMDDEIPF